MISIKKTGPSRIVLILSICILGLITLGCVNGVQPAISGTVTYNGVPSDNFAVSLSDDEKIIKTVTPDEHGYYSFDNIGTARRLTVRYNGLLVYEVGPGISPGIYDYNVRA